MPWCYLCYRFHRWDQNGGISSGFQWVFTFILYLEYYKLGLLITLHAAFCVYVIFIHFKSKVTKLIIYFCRQSSSRSSATRNSFANSCEQARSRGLSKNSLYLHQYNLNTVCRVCCGSLCFALFLYSFTGVLALGDMYAMIMQNEGESWTTPNTTECEISSHLGCTYWSYVYNRQLTPCYFSFISTAFVKLTYLPTSPQNNVVWWFHGPLATCRQHWMGKGGSCQWFRLG